MGQGGGGEEGTRRRWTSGERPPSGSSRPGDPPPRDAARGAPAGGRGEPVSVVAEVELLAGLDAERVLHEPLPAGIAEIEPQRPGAVVEAVSSSASSIARAVLHVFEVIGLLAGRIAVSRRPHPVVDRGKHLDLDHVPHVRGRVDRPFADVARVMEHRLLRGGLVGVAAVFEQGRPPPSEQRKCRREVPVSVTATCGQGKSWRRHGNADLPGSQPRSGRLGSPVARRSSHAVPLQRMLSRMPCPAPVASAGPQRAGAQPLVRGGARHERPSGDHAPVPRSSPRWCTSRTGGLPPYTLDSWRELSALRASFRIPDQDWVRAVGYELQAPRVIRLMTCDRGPRQGLRFNRRNVFARDGNQCQYCGKHFPTSELSLDHVVPRSRGGDHELGEHRLRLRGLQRPQGRPHAPRSPDATDPPAGEAEAEPPALDQARQPQVRELEELRRQRLLARRPAYG